MKIATTLPVWRVPSRSALRVLPGLVRDGLVGDLSADQPLSTFAEPIRALDEWWIPFVRANQAVPPGPGKPLTVIDTGVDLAHPEFATRPSTIALNPQSTSAQFEEHGTAVASVAAAPVNGFGVIGIYPQAALQIWDASPFGDGLTVGDVVQGLDAAIRRGQGVVNLSLGSPFRNPVLDAMVAVTVSSGTLIVAAAGNSRERGSPLEYPASIPHVLTVGALDTKRRARSLLERVAARRSGGPWSRHSRRGADDVPPAQLLRLASPGRASPHRSSPGRRPGSGPCDQRSTSRQLFEVMRASAQDVSSPGYDLFSGFGRLDVPAALTVAAPARDPQEPNEDVTYVKPNGLLHRARGPAHRCRQAERIGERAAGSRRRPA